MRKAFWIVVACLLVLPSIAGARPPEKRRMIDVTDNVNTDQFSGWIKDSLGAQFMICEWDMVDKVGAGGEQPNIHYCFPSNVVAGTCDDATDGETWLNGTNQTATGAFNRIFFFKPNTTVANGSGNIDENITTVLPAVWGFHMNSSGASTTTYTVDCTWW